MKSKRKPRKNGPAEKGLELLHCAEGDPCERVLEIRLDGKVWVNALCGEILPVMCALGGKPRNPG